jgi:RimJ/RimL family protein N-acetyltransferase
MKSEDWRDIHRYTSDPAVVQFLDWGPNTEQQTRADVGASIARRNSVPRLDLFLVATLRESDQVIGGCGLGIAKENPTAASLGFLFNRECWGKGYATECATAMLRFGFERLRLHRVSASCDVLNVSSCRVLEKLGMVREGHLRDGRYHQGRWRDSFVYGILAEEFLVRNLSSSPPVIT